MRKIYGTGCFCTWEWLKFRCVVGIGVVLLLCCAPRSQANAALPAQSGQPRTITVSGRVIDEKGNPLPGVAVIADRAARGETTDASGRYAIRAGSGDALTFSYAGYRQKTIAIRDKTTLDVSLEPAALDGETIVTAFGVRKAESVTAAIATVDPNILRSSGSDLTATFAGRIPGIIAWQTGGLPAALTEEEMNTLFYIRGVSSPQEGVNSSPLIVLDGVESSKLDLARISPDDIAAFSVLKDAQATSLYGARGANGVIFVTTKRGVRGGLRASFSYESVVSQPTREVEIADPLTYMAAYNQALLGRNPDATPKYSAEHIERAASGNYPSWVYPMNDWAGMMFKPMAVNHHFGLNLRGGSKVVQYYASVQHNRDRGTFKADRLSDFDPNIRDNRSAIRLNLDFNLSPGATLAVTANASLDKYRGPLIDPNEAYYMAFAASPVDFAPLYPADDTYTWSHLRFGTTPAGAANPYMELHTGYRERKRYSLATKAEYIQNLSNWVKGLELRASLSMGRQKYSATSFSTVPFLYYLEGYDAQTGKPVLHAQNPAAAHSSLTAVESGRIVDTQVGYEGRLMHTAAWGGAGSEPLHQTVVAAVFNLFDRKDLPHKSAILSMSGTYGFRNRYFVEGSFGYTVSDRLSGGDRKGFFPAVGGAWLLSSERWMQPLSKALPYLKLRATWGKAGNDGIVHSPRFVYLPESPIQWETAEQVNLGLDTKLFGDLLEFNLDAYQQSRHNILFYRTTIPSAGGVEILPLVNAGETRSRGVDLAGKIRHAFPSGFRFILGGTFTYNKTIYTELDEASGVPAWQRKKGEEISRQLGYIAEGLFRDWAEINNAPVQGGDVMPGDIRYKDVKNDGVIDIYDLTCIGYPTVPRVIYGINGLLQFRNVEFNFTFQGSDKRSFFIDPGRISPFSGDHALLAAIYKDHWSEDNMTDRPFWPRLSNQNIVAHNPQEDRSSGGSYSTYFMREAAFLRCTSLELAYNLPATLIKKIGLQKARIYVRTDNPFVVSDFKLWDVELGGNGFNYPIQRTYAVGINLGF